MNRKTERRISLRFQFFLICILELAAAAALAYLAGLGLDQWFGIKLKIPVLLWAVLFSIVIGGGIATYITKTFFDPVVKLGHAMKEVEKGNFKISIHTKSRFRDIRNIYDGFNSMVKELDDTETLQTDFISSVSHEFKTPINAIEGYASLLQGCPDSSPEQEGYVEKILLNTGRLSALVGNILLLSKLENQSIKPQISTFRLDEQIRQAIVALENKWTEKDIDFDIDLDSTEYTGFEKLTFHIWSNLIDNAVKFVPKGGKIVMRLTREGEFTVFSISDNGPGIGQQEKEKIFNKFYQSDLSHETEGNGLGLSLVKRITDLSGGSVTVENLPGTGCRFTVRLPEIAD